LGVKPTWLANTGLKPLSRGPKAPLYRPQQAGRSRDFGALLRSAGRPGPPDLPGAREPAAANSPAAQVSPELFEGPVEPRFAHLTDPADLKAVRLGVRVAASEHGFEVEAVVLDQAGRPVPDAVVLALVNPSGGPAGPSAETGLFLPNTDPFGRTRGTLSPGGPARVKLIAVTGNGLQTAQELDLPAG